MSGTSKQESELSDLISGLMLALGDKIGINKKIEDEDYYYIRPRKTLDDAAGYLNRIHSEHPERPRIIIDFTEVAYPVRMAPIFEPIKNLRQYSNIAIVNMGDSVVIDFLRINHRSPTTGKVMLPYRDVFGSIDEPNCVLMATGYFDTDMI